MDGLGGYHAKRSKSDRERQILYDMTYMWNLKNKLVNITKKQTYREQTSGYQRGEERGEGQDRGRGLKCTNY